MIGMIKLGYTPLSCCWVHKRGQAQALLAMYVSPARIRRLHVNECAAQNSRQEPSGYMTVVVMEIH
jgi:hypothetical protein